MKKYQIVTPYPTGLLRSLNNRLATLESEKFSTDIEITSSSHGLILTSPDGNRWRITINNTGNLQATLL